MGSYETKRIFSRNLSYLLCIRGETQAQLAAEMRVAPSSVSAWCNGEKMPRMDKVEWLAAHFGVGTSALIDEQPVLPSNVTPLAPMNKIPLVGQIACGTPILAEENITDYIDLPVHIRADYALTCKGNSMIDAGIQDGDVVYIRQQPEVENGQIAAVIVNDDNEATLKRFYRIGDTVTLNPANPEVAPLVFVADDINNIRIVGLAVAYTHVLK